jgi:hypothetical protein
MKVEAYLIWGWMVPVLRLRLTVLTFREMFGARFKIFILLLIMFLLLGKWRVLLRK